MPAVRHHLPVRLTHWLNVLTMTVLLMSGLQILCAHPVLYWGERSDPERTFLVISPHVGAKGASEGETAARAIPSWLTLPSEIDLATGRRWHFLFAWIFFLNGAAYLVWNTANGHLKRNLWPTAADLRSLPKTIANHARFRFDHAGGRYNILQQLSYLGVVLIALPLMVWTGLAMSPAMDAAFPFLTGVFGGRQTARTIHFLTAGTLVLFVCAHLLMVVATGFWSNVRSMITGHISTVRRESSNAD